ncbi:hypothetical protein BV25DRAFT_1806462 [Artomyces pyxidatus]|uniref:Uncharacterized protein n=1 Tax=Artomyces pyxidatus TaxID=48021 RepID=A0ACB8SXV1_9AGAM|nr:hypothetical protein BV25DRAFT_1806462 [Artomyces pyxidatus]
MLTPASAEYYFTCLLKVASSTLAPIWNVPQWPGAAFITQPHTSRPLVVTHHRQPLWLIDYVVVGQYGTVIPQRLWIPHSVTDQRQYVAEAQLEMPVFFVHTNGALGVSLVDATAGNCHSLRGFRDVAPIGGKSSTHLRMSWPGYKDWKRQVQTRDETPFRNPITLEKFVRHVGRSVDNFLVQCELDPVQHAPNWRIGGPNGINRNDIMVIGVVHVSAGSWMPILQLSARFVF